MMASIDCENPKFQNKGSVDTPQSKGPKRDYVGISFFVFHLGVSVYILAGWSVPSASALMFYLLLLPVVAMQWMVNRSSCVINNLESFLRTGCWRDAFHPEEGRFISVIVHWMFGITLRRSHTDIVCYSLLMGLWCLALAHLSVLGDPALLSLFP
ncbi:MAG: hypothetical protein RJB62_1865 [Pseudomonadota bacterium]|jgi:hypothetical protein